MPSHKVQTKLKNSLLIFPTPFKSRKLFHTASAQQARVNGLITSTSANVFRFGERVGFTPLAARTSSGVLHGHKITLLELTIVLSIELTKHIILYLIKIAQDDCTWN
jgi:hypothetical protein